MHGSDVHLVVFGSCLHLLVSLACLESICSCHGSNAALWPESCVLSASTARHVEDVPFTRSSEAVRLELQLSRRLQHCRMQLLWVQIVLRLCMVPIHFGSLTMDLCFVDFFLFSIYHFMDRSSVDSLYGHHYLFDDMRMFSCCSRRGRSSM